MQQCYWVAGVAGLILVLLAPTTEAYDGQKFWTRVGGRRVARHQPGRCERQGRREDR